MSYRTSRQDRAAQTNLDGGRRRKPVYSNVLTDDQRAVLAEQERDARPTDTEAAAWLDEDASYREWCAAMDEATAPKPQPVTDDPDDMPI